MKIIFIYKLNIINIIKNNKFIKKFEYDNGHKFIISFRYLLKLSIPIWVFFNLWTCSVGSVCLVVYGKT